jgi:hypothetical protein
VLTQALRLSTHSWEFGTLSEALLELYNPSFSVFSLFTAHLGTNLSRPSSEYKSTPALEYAKQHINLTISAENGTLVNGDGAAGDPASLGVLALLLGRTDPAYAEAARRQKDRSLKIVPQLSNGAISQRGVQHEAWSDWMFMVPPFLAFYALVEGDEELLRETVRQCGLYRDVLQVQNKGYWRHIVSQDPPSEQGRNEDLGVWSTGNGWAVMGLARVMGTVKEFEELHCTARQVKDLRTEIAQLVQWSQEIIDGARSVQPDPSTGLLRNYLPDTSWFGDTSGSALLAAATYRLMVLAPATFAANEGYADWTGHLKDGVASHVNAEGILAPSVNPLGWLDREPAYTGSPEGRNFGVMLFAAWRGDCVCTGVCVEG